MTAKPAMVKMLPNTTGKQPANQAALALFTFSICVFDTVVVDPVAKASLPTVIATMQNGTIRNDCNEYVASASDSLPKFEAHSGITPIFPTWLKLRFQRESIGPSAQSCKSTI
jgi:hypothetical protein